MLSKSFCYLQPAVLQMPSPEITSYCLLHSFQRESTPLHIFVTKYTYLQYGGILYTVINLVLS